MVKGATLEVGMLWFDDTPGRPVMAIIERAVEHYTEKYGEVPSVCLVHPDALADEGYPGNSVNILPAPNVLPHHFWLGVARDALKRDTGAQMPTQG
jgi:hypothetical protein